MFFDRRSKSERERREKKTPYYKWWQSKEVKDEEKQRRKKFYTLSNLFPIIFIDICDNVVVKPFGIAGYERMTHIHAQNLALISI